MSLKYGWKWLWGVKEMPSFMRNAYFNVYTKLQVMLWRISDFGVIRSQHGHYAFPQIFNVGVANWTVDPSMETVNYEKELANNKFILLLSNILASHFIIWTKKRVIIDVEIWIIETYILLKSHLAFQICTFSYRIFLTFLRNFIWRNVSLKKWRL